VLKVKGTQELLYWSYLLRAYIGVKEKE